MAIPLIYLAAAGVVAYASRKKQLQGADPFPVWDPNVTNPLVAPGPVTGTTRGGLAIASQLQRDRFIKGQGTSPVTPPTNHFVNPGGAGGKPIGFR